MLIFITCAIVVSISPHPFVRYHLFCTRLYWISFSFCARSRSVSWSKEMSLHISSSHHLQMFIIKIHMYLKLIVLNSQNIFLYILILWVSSFKLHYIFISIHLLHNIIIKKKNLTIRIYVSLTTRHHVDAWWSLLSLIFSCLRTPDSFVNIMLKRELSTMDNFWRNRSITNYRSEIFPIYWTKSLAGLIDQTQKSSFIKCIWNPKNDMTRITYRIIHSFHYTFCNLYCITLKWYLKRHV